MADMSTVALQVRQEIFQRTPPGTLHRLSISMPFQIPGPYTLSGSLGLQKNVINTIFDRCNTVIFLDLGNGTTNDLTDVQRQAINTVDDLVEDVGEQVGVYQ